jgi:hypothetical protein
MGKPATEPANSNWQIVISQSKTAKDVKAAKVKNLSDLLCDLRALCGKSFLLTGKKVLLVANC